jgi:hypothetical protein
MKISDLSAKRLAERLIQPFIRSDERAAFQRVLIFAHARDRTARFPDQKDAGRDVPRLQLTLPVTLVPTGRHIGEVEGG